MSAPMFPLLSVPTMPDQPPTLTLADILKLALRHYPTQRALAVDLLLSESRLGKVLRGEDESMTVERCLLLARIVGLPPSDVLRAARKPEAARLIEQMYGPERRTSPRPLLTPEQTALIRRLGKLNQGTQRKLLDVLHHILAIAGAAEGERLEEGQFAGNHNGDDDERG